MNPQQKIIRSAVEIAPLIRARSLEIEQFKRLPPDIVQLIKDAGVFRMTMPRSWGGLEVDPMTQLHVIEELSYADGSTGWCAMIGSDGGYLSAFIDQTLARKMYSDINAVTAVALRADKGRATLTEKGYFINGRWPFATGCEHSDWAAVNCTVFDKKAIENRICFIPKDSFTIINNWSTTGLCGTGSNDIEVKNFLVPKEQTLIFPDPPIFRPGPLYAFPYMFLSNFSGVILGIARRSLEISINLASQKITEAGVVTGNKQYIQSAIGQAQTLVNAGRSYIFKTLEELWISLVAGHKPTLAQRMNFRLAIKYVHDACITAIDLLYKTGGGSSIYSACPLERCFRDAHTLNQHRILSAEVYEAAGRLLLGIQPDLLFL